MRNKMGIRHKIMLGFCALGFLFFFSALTSYFELTRLNHSTQDMLDRNLRNVEFSKQMLDGVEEESASLIKMIITGEQSSDSSLLAGRQKFDKAMKELRANNAHHAIFDSIDMARQDFNRVVNTRFGQTHDETTHEWLASEYQVTHHKLTGAIRGFIVFSQKDMEGRAQELEKNAYRAITPGIIALAIAILIIIVFFYMIDVYYIRPVLKMTDGLHKYLTSNTPFRVTFEGRDEVFQLKGDIEELITRFKDKKPCSPKETL